MSSARPSLQTLPADQRRQIERLLEEFRGEWDEARLVREVDRLPPLGSSLRAVAIVELVKIDLDRQWRRGRGVRLEGYLSRFPELGTSDSVDERLVKAECDVLSDLGLAIDWQQVARRFPRQVDSVRAARACSQPTLPPAPWYRSSGPPTATGTHAPQFGQAPHVSPAPTQPLRTTQAQRTTAPSAVTPPDRGELPETFGRYRIKKRLAQGGMGAVYLARDTTLDRDVALKVPLVEGDDRGEWLARFYREARASAALRHPNLCPVYDVGEIDGTPYLTMAYIKGRTLAQMAGRPYPPPQAAGIARKIALALAEAHRRGVLHRDLKPANVMIDRRGEPIVMDFGLARRGGVDDPRLTRSGTMLGTPAYMPPEQVLGDLDALGPACDVYGVGVILYELLCGRPPFQGATPAVLRQVLGTAPPLPSQVNPDIDPRLEAICLKAMAKDPGERHASMDELAADLTDYLRTAMRGGAPLARTSGRRDSRLWQAGMGLAALVCAAPLVFLGMTRLDHASDGRPVAAAGSAPTAPGAKPPPATTKSAKKKAVSPPAGKPTAKLFVSARQAVTLRPGQRETLAIRVKREGCKGAVRLSVSGLPDSVACNDVVLDADKSHAHVELIAAGDAVPASAQARIIASLGDLQATTQATVTVALKEAPAAGKPPSGNPAGGGTAEKREPAVADAPAGAKPAVGERQEFTNSVGMKLVRIPAGEFRMGSDESPAVLRRWFGELPNDLNFSTADEQPQHLVKITHSFDLGAYEVTRAQFARFVDDQGYYTDAERDGYGGWGWDLSQRGIVQSPMFTWRFTGFLQDDDHPVVNVSWNDAQAFCDWLSAKEQKKYRLPTEAEWEYACRGGTTTRFYSGGEPRSLVTIANVADATAGLAFAARFTVAANDGFAFTAPVGSFRPNPFGLYDMLGNVWEWCNDWYGARYYLKSPEDDPPGAAVGLTCVARGGSFADPPVYDRCSKRGSLDPVSRYCAHGFRVACEPE
jgi:formylglycine-generating enzyme required for sulfatase activity